MAEVWCFPQFLLLCFAVVFPAAESRFIRVPEGHRPAGVLLLIEGWNYTLNFTAAKDACQSVNGTIATIEQVQRALEQGLETCKYGWTAERLAVIPRITPDAKCGKNNTGVVVWAATLDTKFGVFCFNASDSQETLHTPSSAPPKPTALMTKTAAVATPVSFTPANCYGHFLNSFTSCFILLTSVLSLLHAHFL